MYGTKQFGSEQEKEGISMRASPPLTTTLVGPHIKYLNHAFARRFSEIARNNGLDEFSIVHGHILGFLLRNSHRDVYQRDLEETFNITRSSVTGVVKQLEKTGCITRQSVAGDARLKKLCLTPQGMEICRRTRQALDQVEDLAIRGLTPEQCSQFLDLCRIIEGNLSEKKECAHAKNHSVPGEGV